MGAVVVRVPAKINLSLRVGPRRADGYHELATVFHAVSLYDEIEAAPSDRLEITVEGDGRIAAHAVPLDGTNLAVRAAELLARCAGVKPTVHLRLRKGIPVAGGMAGGSADAAAALLACDALWRTGLDRDELHGLAAQLGRDVPFALLGGTAIGAGRGERLTQALARGRFDWVVALAEGGLSTPAVYAECDRLRAGRPVPDPVIDDDLMAALRAGDPHRLGPLLANDLQAAACSLRPALHRTLAIGEEYGALGSMVSGSGPTCVFLVADHDAGLDLAAALEAGGTCAEVRHAHGPVHGARLVDGRGSEGEG
jgi:4-diphosphocytidyl-2-C-methyl-D-erythritol kinase